MCIKPLPIKNYMSLCAFEMVLGLLTIFSCVQTLNVFASFWLVNGVIDMGLRTCAQFCWLWWIEKKMSIIQIDQFDPEILPVVCDRQLSHHYARESNMHSRVVHTSDCLTNNMVLFYFNFLVVFVTPSHKTMTSKKIEKLYRPEEVQVYSE